MDAPGHFGPESEEVFLQSGPGRRGVEQPRFTARAQYLLF